MIVYVLLGLIQGLTEFLPVSSSGHLVLAERLFGFTSPGLICEASLHLGTLAAILVVFRRDLADLFRALTPRGTIERRKEIGFLVIGTVPIVVLGLLLRGTADRWFHSLWVLGIGWLATAAMLHAAQRRAAKATSALPSAAGSLGIGIAQSVALAPGVSRSGFSIGAGILAGLRPERAARFSFLLSIPAVAGAAGLTLWDGLSGPAAGAADLLGILLGTGVAFLVGLLALRVLLQLVARGCLWPFAVYCGALSIVTLVLAALG
jgi:undecaprenyl-diphosphatase